MTTKQDLKARRVEAGITRKQAAEACGISQFRLDRLERGDVDDADAIKSYADGLEKLIAVAKTAKATPAKKAPAKKTAAKKATQPKAAEPAA